MSGSRKEVTAKFKEEIRIFRMVPKAQFLVPSIYMYVFL